MKQKRLLVGVTSLTLTSDPYNRDKYAEKFNWSNKVALLVHDYNKLVTQLSWDPIVSVK